MNFKIFSSPGTLIITSKILVINRIFKDNISHQVYIVIQRRERKERGMGERRSRGERGKVEGVMHRHKMRIYLMNRMYVLCTQYVINFNKY